MRVSLNQIKQYIEFALPPVDELVDTINRQLGGVELVTDLGERYAGAVIVRIDSCEKHPNADKLSVCQVNDGSGETVQVVCGAPNVHAGMYAVWLKPGSVVPATAGDKEPFVLGARELRGEMSNGMLASSKELGIGDSHEGILEIDEHERTADGSVVSAGASFAKTFGLDDISIEIENKMFTHRPDLFGQLGVAREIAGIKGNAFKSPDWYTTGSAETPQAVSNTLPLEVFNESHQNVPRFTAITMKGIHVKPSPLWLQCALVRMGGKPINNVVDLTNYVMLLTAQPTHAYDYDKIHGATIGARMATDGESITLLNGKAYTLNTADIVIADGEGPIGLAGIMGGGDSEVSATTTNLILEVANFNMYTLRKSSMRHGVFTDALTRFNKGQSPYQNIVVMNELVKLLEEIAGGTIASELLDIGDGFDRAYDGKSHLEAGTVTTEFINTRLGTELSGPDVATLLTNVEFAIKGDGNTVIYQPPFWRTDIIEPEDIVEEVGRLYGFDKLPRVLPSRSTKPPTKNPRRELKRQLRESLSKLGGSEVLTYSFVNEKLLTKSGQDPDHAYSLSNALSPDLQYYRLSLSPSLLDKIAPNYRAGYDTFALFEFGKSHFKGEMDEHEPDVPNEDEHMAFVIAGNDLGGTAFYNAKRYFEQVVDTQDLQMIPTSDFVADDEWGRQMIAPYAKDRSVVIVKKDQIWGVVGEFSEHVKKAFKLPNAAAGFEVHLDVARAPHTKYEPLSRFPGTTRDISIKVRENVAYGEVADTLRTVLGRLDDSFTSTLEPISIYKVENATEKTFTFRVSFVRHDRTLRDDEVNEIMDQVSAASAERHQATIV
jgi:phenylalanyl-tRNA synthetase beta chain